MKEPEQEVEEEIVVEEEVDTEKAEEEEEEEEVGGNGLARTESQTTIESDVFELDNVLYYLTRSREGNDFLYEFVDHDNKYQSVLLAETVKGYSKKWVDVKSYKKKTR